MLEAGLEEEARKLYPKRGLSSLDTVGYRELFGYFDDLYDREEAVRLIKRNSRRYAKRQLTWLRSVEDAIRIDLDQEQNPLKLILSKLAE
jgi:tRNA dimethylallyltransferase